MIYHDEGNLKGKKREKKSTLNCEWKKRILGDFGWHKKMNVEEMVFLKGKKK